MYTAQRRTCAYFQYIQKGVSFYRTSTLHLEHRQSLVKIRL